MEQTGAAVILASILSISILPMIFLSIILTYYQPSVQSCIPLLVEEESLIQANGIIVQINTLSSLLTVGLPVISNITLALPAQYYGYLEAGLGVGSILGCIALSTIFKKHGIKQIYQFLLAVRIAISVISLCTKSTLKVIETASKCDTI